MISDVRPDISRRSGVSTRSVDPASSPVVGSSSSSTGALRIIARAIARRCRCPPDSIRPRCPIRVS